MNRPKVTKQIIEQAAAALSKKQGYADAKAREIAKVFAVGMDGYEMAKELENMFCWDICVMDVDALDGMQDLVRGIHKQVCIEWEAANNIQPPYPTGARITRGVIKGICTHEPATYLVKENGCTNESRCLLVKFEDAIQVSDKATQEAGAE